MTWQQVWARRLARHFLLKRAPYQGLVQTVGAVCGIQAQVMLAAELSVGIRVDAVTRNDVQAALWERRALVKTYGIRGTIHLFPSDELPLWMAALRAHSALEVKKQQALGLDAVQPRTIPSQLPVLLVDGMVAGLWERETKGKRVEVRVEPFASLERRQRSLVEEEASRIGLLLGLEAELTIGPVSVRPHL